MPPGVTDAPARRRPLVIAFTGLPGSGKSEAVRVARERDVPVIRMGDFILEEVQRRGHPPDEEHIGPVATGMRNEHGADVWARRTLERLPAATADGRAPLVVIDGVRSLAEIERFRSELGAAFVLVAIDAADELRHERLRGRGRSDDPQDLAVIAARDAREKGWGIEDAVRRADHRIENDADLERLRARIGALLERLAA